MTAKLNSATAKKLKLKGAVATAKTGLVAAGVRTVVQKFTKAAKKKLKRQRKVTLILSGAVTDGAGNARPISGKVTLKR